MGGYNKFFPIIMWLEAHPVQMGYDMTTAQEFYEKSFADIASLHCNTVRPSNLPLDYADLFLRSAGKYNLKVIMDPQFGNKIIKKTVTQIQNEWESLKKAIKSSVIDPFSGHENLLGYVVADEPRMDQLEQWKLIVKMFHELDPLHPDFTVFNEPENLKAVVNSPDTIMGNIVYDNYPHEIFAPYNTMGTPSKPDYDWYNRYSGFYEASIPRPTVPQISTVAIFKNDRPWRFPTPGEFRTTVYTSLAEGAKGIMFFVYMDVPSTEKLIGLVDKNWNPNPYPSSYPYPYPPLYETVKVVAGELEQLGPLAAELQQSRRVSGWETTAASLAGKYKGRYAEYFIIAHKDPDPGHAYFHWQEQLPKAHCLVDMKSGEMFIADAGGKVTVPLEPAQGRVLKKRLFQDAPLFGSFDLPGDDNSKAAGAIALTGWALGVSPVRAVEIKRSPVPGDPSSCIGPDGLVFIGSALFIEGARPDIAELYSEFPDCKKAGWGYMLLTNFLPNKGNGVFTFHAIATDFAGNKVTLGQKNITCDNALSVKPFGNIDTPAQGGTISGSAYANFGWVLTPLPNMIPVDGSTITVWIDGVPVGRPDYNMYRKDIEAYFPGLSNSKGAVGCFILDTTKYRNGIHTISWTVKDNAGNESGIGSRYFWIQNPQLLKIKREMPWSKQVKKIRMRLMGGSKLKREDARNFIK